MNNTITDKDTPPLPMPGLDVVGRGIYLKSRGPYELKNLIFKQENFTPYYNQESDTYFQVPVGYNINDSPPMPAGKSLNSVVIEESMERLDKKMNIDASVASSSMAFSVDASASQSSSLQRDGSAYYAIRSSFIPFWSIYVSDSSMVSDDQFDVDIPVPFKHVHRRQYDRFFERYGSHFVRRVWIGGRATLTFSVLKSSDMSEDDIRAGIKASFGAIGSGEANSQLTSKKEKLMNNSECTVSGKGGDAVKLATLSTLDEVNYNEWLQTIQDNPQAIELEVTGIWTLIKDPEKSAALMAAYKEATAFVPVSAVGCIGQDVYFIRGRDYSVYNVETKECTKPHPLKNKWPELSDFGFHRVDAMLSGDYLGFSKKNRLSGQALFFRRDHFMTLDLATNTFTAPVPVSVGFPGVTFDRIDAALHFEPDFVYLFSGENYVRFNLETNQVDEGYPQLISERWLGVNFDKINAAIYWGSGKVFFFNEDRHIRYDVSNYRADPGYPRFITGNYVEDWKLFG